MDDKKITIRYPVANQKYYISNSVFQILIKSKNQLTFERHPAAVLIILTLCL